MYQKLNPKHNRSDGRAGDSKCKGSRFKPRLDPMRPTLKHMDTNDETIRLWAKAIYAMVSPQSFLILSSLPFFSIFYVRLLGYSILLKARHDKFFKQK